MIYLHKIILEWILQRSKSESALVVEIVFGVICLLIFLLFYLTRGE